MYSNLKKILKNQILASRTLTMFFGKWHKYQETTYFKSYTLIVHLYTIITGYLLYVYAHHPFVVAYKPSIFFLTVFSNYVVYITFMKLTKYFWCEEKFFNKTFSQKKPQHWRYIMARDTLHKKQIIAFLIVIILILIIVDILFFRFFFTLGKGIPVKTLLGILLKKFLLLLKKILLFIK